MLPLASAVARYQKNLHVDYVLQKEHERRIGNEIKRAIDDELPSVRYEVTQLHGPYAPTENLVLAMKLIDSARDVCHYRVRLVSTEPPTLELSGWKEEADATAARARHAARTAASAVKKKPPPPAASAAKKKKAAEEEFIIVHDSSSKKRR